MSEFARHFFRRHARHWVTDAMLSKVHTAIFYRSENAFRVINWTLDMPKHCMNDHSCASDKTQIIVEYESSNTANNTTDVCLKRCCNMNSIFVSLLIFNQHFIVARLVLCRCRAVSLEGKLQGVEVKRQGVRGLRISWLRAPDHVAREAIQ